MENGDRVRVDKLENGLSGVQSEVATLTGRFDTHINQVADHRREAIAENVTRDKLSNVHHGEIMRGINKNATELAAFNRLDKDRSKRVKEGTISTEFPANPTPAPLGTGAKAGIGTGIVAGIVVTLEAIKWIVETVWG